MSHRLLYRGALTLPDSHLLLDGVSFTAALSTGEDEIGKDSSRNLELDLLNHPLALALESMRGRPSLHFLGAIKLSEVWIDEKSTGVVSMDVHPQASLTRMYFETLFCLDGSITPFGRSEYGFRISLSDNDDPSASDILVYAQVSANDCAASVIDHASTSNAPSEPIQIVAARLLPGPPPAPAPPRPRPDDPTPRVPPSALASKRKRDISPAGQDKRSRITTDRGKEKATANDIDAEALRKARETMKRMPKPPTTSTAAPVAARANGKESKRGEFKVPKVPQWTESVLSPMDDGDMFGAGYAAGTQAQSPEEQEKTNKTVVKQATVRCLADHAINKQHPEFNDLYQTIYRGASFALRSQMRAGPVDLWSVYKFVDAHAKLYVLSPA